MPEPVTATADFALVRPPSGPRFGWRGAGLPVPDPLRSVLISNGYLYDAGGGTAWWTWEGLLAFDTDLCRSLLVPN